MKIIISPAKSLDFKTELPTKNFSTPNFLSESKKINELLKKKLASNLPNSPLFNTAKFTKNLESAFIKISDNQYKELKPDHIFIEDINK